MLKYKIICLILILTLITSLTAININYAQLNEDDNSIYVDDNLGDDNNPGTITKPKKTIKNATESLKHDGNILIRSGHYLGEDNRNITLHHSIKIKGEGNGKTVIDGESRNVLFIVSPRISVGIEGVTLTKAGTREFDPYEGVEGAITNYGRLDVANCVFLDNLAYHRGDLNPSNDINNFDGGKGVIRNCTFINHHPSDHNLSILNWGSKCQIEDCTFTLKSGTDIFSYKGSCTIKNTLFNSTPDNYVNCITNQESRLIMDNSTLKGLSSGITTIDGNATITNTLFKNGGSVSNDNGTTTISKCYFLNSGGIGNYGYCKVTECKFINNTDFGSEFKSGMGGAIVNGNYYDPDNDNSSINIINCLFKNNKAEINNKSKTPSEGGAIYNCGKCSINGCTFTRNSANKGGAIINQHKGTCNLHFSRFVANHAQEASDIFNADGVVDARYNWWGTNKGPLKNKGKIDSKEWLELTVKTEKPEISLGQSSKIITDLYTDSVGGYHQKEADKYPEMVPLVFKTSWGSITQNPMRTAISQNVLTLPSDVKAPPLLWVSAADAENPTDTVNIQLKIKQETPPIPPLINPNKGNPNTPQNTHIHKELKPHLKGISQFLIKQVTNIYNTLVRWLKDLLKKLEEFKVNRIPLPLLLPLLLVILTVITFTWLIKKKKI